jgi:N-acetylmuramoyl-L-alanine amidase
MIYTVNHIPRNTPNNRRPGLPMRPTTITIHNTGNKTSTAQNERSWLTNPSNKRTASYHIVIDEREAIECIPLNESSWASGDGSAPTSGNRSSIQIEICESGNYAKVVENAVNLTARLLKERSWNTTNLRRHWDWSRKVCPRLMYDNGTWKTWNEFVEKVNKELEEDEVTKAQIEDLEKRLKNLENLSSMNPPPWAKAAVDEAVKKGLINNPNGGSQDFYRLVTILHRRGLL